MSKIKTWEVVHHATGDIWGPHGAILGKDHVPVGSGTVRVTAKQAAAAVGYGWEVVSEDDGIVLISRSPEKAKLYSRKKQTPTEPCKTAKTPESKLLSCIILAYKRADRAEITSQQFEDYALGLIAAYVPGSEAVSVVPREPRQLLAQAYLDNGDYGSAATIRSGHDLTPNTQIALLAIKNALAQVKTS
jgi:hypothetical protein